MRKPKRDGRRSHGLRHLDRVTETSKERPEGHYVATVDEREVEIELPLLAEEEGRKRLRNGEEHLVQGGLTLKVGRHGGRLGIVYLVRPKGKTRSRHVRDGLGNRDRGLVEWDNSTSDSLSLAVARLAVKYAGITDGERTVQSLHQDWRGRAMWKDLVSRHGSGERLDAVREVMET